MADFLYLRVTALGAPLQVRATINGYPSVDRTLGEASDWIDMVNQHACGAQNRIALRIGGPPGAACQLSLRRFAPGMVVTPEDGESVALAPLDPISPFPGADGAVRFALPAAPVPGDYVMAEAQWSCALPGADFSALYHGEARPPEAQARAGAEALLKAFRAGDGGMLARAWEAKAADLALAYDMPPDALRADMEQSLAEAFKTGAAPAEEGEEIALTPWADGRLLEATLDDGPLLRTVLVEDAGMEFRIFLGMRDGRLQALR